MDGKMKRERWLPVVGYESRYLVSDLGNVFSIKADFVMKQTPNNYGYLWIDLWDGVKRRRRAVHHVVLEAFVEPHPPGLECLHGNDIKTDNRLSNLRWGTRSENAKDIIRNGNNFQCRKTKCRNGHDYTPENTRISEGPGYRHRYCVICHLDNCARARRKAGQVKRKLKNGMKGRPCPSDCHCGRHRAHDPIQK
jgi:hypothetical protein